ncbi:MAG: hypothetical protein U0353_07595 [Sandaracinus sp.]
MLRGFELRYLASVAEGNDYPVALRTIPAIVRGMAARGARRRVSEVMLASSFADDARHVHRVAYLRAIGREPPSFDDQRAIAEAFAAHRDRGRESRAPLVLAASLLGVAGVVIVAVAAYGQLTRRTPPVVLPSTTASVPLPTVADPEPEAAAAHPLEPLMREAIPMWVVALDAQSAGRTRPPPDDVATRHAGVLTALADAHAAPEIVEATRAFLEAAEAYSEEGGPPSEDPITAHLVALDDALARAGAPFYVDALLLESRYERVYGERRRVLASTFRVRERRVFTSGERRITSLDLERLDTLSFERSLLGYTRPDVRYALVLTSRVESYLVTEAIPAMHAPEESVIARGYEDERDAGWVTPFEAAVHEVLREEAGHAAPVESVRALAAATARRRHAFEALGHELEQEGVRLVVPETYGFDLLELSGVLSMVEPETRREVREAQAGLDAPAVAATYRAIEEAELLSIARHEAQHRVDYEDDRIVAVPDALAAYTGRTESEDLVNRLAERSNAELSAYLSQVAREPTRARSHLVEISRFVMNREAWGMPESYAALVIFEVLAERLGLVHGPVVVSRRIQRAELAAIFLGARARSGEELAQAAREAWRGLYGVELPELVLSPE